jgi:hypothetical protein
MAQTSNDLAGTAKTKPTTVFHSWPMVDRPAMRIHEKAELTCRCCAASVETGAWRCHHCGEAHRTSDLRAVVLSPFALAFYIVAVLAFMTFWFWQDF